MTTTEGRLFSDIDRSVAVDSSLHRKVTIVGVGQVGMACASSILQKGLVRELCLVDVVEDKLKGEMMDLQHAAALHAPVIINASTDYSITAGSDVCVITAGARQREGESRLSLIDRNLAIFKSVVSQLVKYSPNSVLMVVSNPVDVLTWVTWKLSGFPPNRVIGSGTMLDSSRFRFMLAEKLNVSPKSVHAYIIGEHGDSSVPVWSSATVGGVRLRSVYRSIDSESDTEWAPLAQKVKDSAYEVIKLKGYTSWAIGSCVAVLVGAILHDSHEIFPVSVLVKGFHNIEEEVFLSVPVVLTRQGATRAVDLKLEADELKKLSQSVQALSKTQKSVTF